MNEGETHSLSCWYAKTPILTRWSCSVLKVFKWIQGTGKGLECAGLTFGSMSMCTFYVDKHQEFHQTSFCFPTTLKANLLFGVD
jgi:hypothetical protein